MGIRPAKCYRSPKGGWKIRKGACGFARHIHQQRSYTRTAKTVPRKNYIGATPQLKIRQFNMGNPLLPYDTVVDLLITKSLDLRDNAIESVRMTVNRHLVKVLGKDAYFMKVRVYPSQILRENKQAQGAGADRVSQGMTLPFGIPIGRAARVKAGQVIFSVLCMDAQKEIAKNGLMRAQSKIPCAVKVKIHKDVKSLGTLPSKSIEEKVVVEKKEEVVTAEGATAEGTTEAGKTTAGTKGAPAGKDAGKTPAAGTKGAPAKPETGKTPAAGTKGAPAKPEAGKKK